MNETDTPKAETEGGRLDAEEREENAVKAQETAERLFPGHEWRRVEDGIYLSPRRPIGKKSSYAGELRNAQMLRDMGYTVYLAPEQRSVAGAKFDAIVNGLLFEFKNVSGNANTLEAQFLRSRSQAPNVFINLGNSELTRREIISALHWARNSRSRMLANGKTIKGYDAVNRFIGGKIILKIRGHDGLFCLDVDDLKIQRE